LCYAENEKWEVVGVVVLLERRKVIVREVEGFGIDFERREFYVNVGYYSLRIPLTRGAIKRAREFLARYGVQETPEMLVYPGFGGTLDLTFRDGREQFIGPLPIHEVYAIAGLKLDVNVVTIPIPPCRGARKRVVLRMEYWYPLRWTTTAEEEDEEGVEEYEE
jgi:hypothetical protein